MSKPGLVVLLSLFACGPTNQLNRVRDAEPGPDITDELDAGVVGRGGSGGGAAGGGAAGAGSAGTGAAGAGAAGTGGVGGGAAGRGGASGGGGASSTGGVGGSAMDAGATDAGVLAMDMPAAVVDMPAASVDIPAASPDVAIDSAPDLSPDVAPDVAPDASGPDVVDGGSLLAGLLAHWKLDEGAGTSAADSTGNGNTGSLVNGPLWVTAPPLRTANPFALSLDGVDDHVEFQVRTLPAIQAPKTFALWVKYDVAPSSGNQNFLALSDPGAPNQAGNTFPGAGAQIGFRGASLVVWKWGGADLVSAAPPPAGLWHHIAYTFDGTTHVLYVDGVQVATTTNPSQVAATVLARLGTYDPANMNPERYKGSLDDVRIYGRPLTSAEVSALSQGQ